LNHLTESRCRCFHKILCIYSF